jgi:hypothetical protein
VRVPLPQEDPGMWARHEYLTRKKYLTRHEYLTCKEYLTRHECLTRKKYLPCRVQVHLHTATIPAGRVRDNCSWQVHLLLGEFVTTALGRCTSYNTRAPRAWPTSISSLLTGSRPPRVFFIIICRAQRGRKVARLHLMIFLLFYFLFFRIFAGRRGVGEDGAAARAVPDLRAPRACRQAPRRQAGAQRCMLVVVTARNGHRVLADKHRAARRARRGVCL